jgi:hypothetical protein
MAVQSLHDDVLAYSQAKAALMDLSIGGPPMATEPGPACVNIEPDPMPHSWRNSNSPLYRKSWLGGRLSLLFVAKVLVVVMFIVIAIMLLPLAAAPQTLRGANHALTAMGQVNYLSAEHQEQAKLELARLREVPHDGDSLGAQFNHGINSHLPEGVTSRIDHARYEKDEQCGLVMHRVPGVTDAQASTMRTMLRDMAPDVVAYSMEQITGYNGVEPPMSIDLNTTAPIFCPPRRNWSPAEVEVIDEKCSELLQSGIVDKVTTS